MNNRWLIDNIHFKRMWDDYQWIYQDEVKNYMLKKSSNIFGKVTKTKYNKYYLTTVWWYTIRHKIKLRDDSKCCECGCDESSGLNFHVHHINGDYKHLGEEILYLDTLQHLCENCHSKAHGRPVVMINEKPIIVRFNETVLIGDDINKKDENIKLNNAQLRWEITNNLNFILEQLKSL